MTVFISQPRTAIAPAIFALLLHVCFATPSRAAPNVVVTIKPIHSLVAVILEGVAQPKLLLDGAASPHSYTLKPSDAEALSNADAVIRVSTNLEVFLEKALRTLPNNARIIDLERTPGLTLLPVRQGGSLLQDAADEHAEPNDGHGRGEGGIDVHFWLDPINAIAITESIARQFSEMDPDHDAHYKANAHKLKVQLVALNEELKTRLAPLSDKPFIVFHDIAQYFEKRYGLSSLGAITLSPERAPGAKRLTGIRAMIKQTHAICVFSEPQFPPKLIQTLTEGTDARQGVLDEIGAAIPSGPDHYFALLRGDAESLAACLNP